MPSCEEFFDALKTCLLASPCHTTLGLRPTQCIDLLLQSKDKSKDKDKEDASTATGKYAPFECKKAHRAWSECRVAMVNPRKRFRPAYSTGLDDKASN